MLMMRRRQPAVQLLVPLGVAAEADRHAVRDHLEDAAEGVLRHPGRLDLLDHLLGGVGVGAADVRRVHLGPERRDFRILRAGRLSSSTYARGRDVDRADPDRVAPDLDAEMA